MAADDPKTERLSPVEGSQRLAGLDVLRGFALYGVFLVNAFVSARPFEIAIAPPDASEGRGELLAWLAFDVLFSMKFVTLFSLLFGVGLALQHQRAEAKGLSIARVYPRRLLVLAAMGLVHGCLLFEGDILFVYALAGALLYALRARPARALTAVAVAFFAFGLLLSIGWAWIGDEMFADEPDELADAYLEATRTGGLADVLALRPVMYVGWLALSSVISFNWRVVAFLFLGAALAEARLDLPGPRRAPAQGCLDRHAGGRSRSADSRPRRSCATTAAPDASSGAIAEELGSAVLAFGFAGAVLAIVHAGRMGPLVARARSRGAHGADELPPPVRSR